VIGLFLISRTDWTVFKSRAGWIKCLEAKSRRWTSHHMKWITTAIIATHH